MNSNNEMKYSNIDIDVNNNNQMN